MTSKKEKKILGIFSKHPLIWLHYVILVVAIYAMQLFAVKVGLYTIFLSPMGWIWSLAYNFLIIAIFDQIIHAVLGVD